MKKYEIIVNDDKAEELKALLKTLPYISLFRESDAVDPITLASEESLKEDWMTEEDNELQKMYGK